MRRVIGRRTPRAGRRWGRISVLVAAALAATATGCSAPPALDPAVTATPVPSSPESSTPTASASGTPSGSTTPRASASPRASTSPSASTSPRARPSTPPANPTAKAAGSLTLYQPASKKLTGTCATTSGAPTLKVTDRSNDFFGTIDATLVLSAQRTTVSTLTIRLGEDPEAIARTLSYNAARPANDASVNLTAKGATFLAKGKLTNTENGKAAGTMPVTLTITCATTTW